MELSRWNAILRIDQSIKRMNMRNQAHRKIFQKWSMIACGGMLRSIVGRGNANSVTCNGGPEEGRKNGDMGRSSSERTISILFRFLSRFLGRRRARGFLRIGVIRGFFGWRLKRLTKRKLIRIAIRFISKIPKGLREDTFQDIEEITWNFSRDMMFLAEEDYS